MKDFFVELINEYVLNLFGRELKSITVADEFDLDSVTLVPGGFACNGRIKKARRELKVLKLRR